MPVLGVCVDVGVCLVRIDLCSKRLVRKYMVLLVVVPMMVYYSCSRCFLCFVRWVNIVLLICTRVGPIALCYVCGCFVIRVEESLSVPNSCKKVKSIPIDVRRRH